MFKISVMYPATPGARFDHHYYRDRHFPLVKSRLGDACLFWTIDKGVGVAPDGSPLYVAVGNIFVESVEAFKAAIAPHQDEIGADIPNYTDIKPFRHFSEVFADSRQA